MAEFLSQDEIDDLLNIAESNEDNSNDCFIDNKIGSLFSKDRESPFLSQEEIEELLGISESDEDVCINIDNDKFILNNHDYILAYGGDGTLLRAIKEFKHLEKPFYGQAAGTVNFLMNEEGEPNVIHKSKKFDLIKVLVFCHDDLVKTIEVFNEVCIGGDMSSWITFDVEEKDEFFGTFKGSGLIISTPQGSTGINKNNNGSVLPLSSNLWSITGDKTNRKIEYVIKPRKTVIKVESRTPVTVWGDGLNYVIENVKEVHISKGDSVRVIFNNYNEFKRKRRI